MLEVPPSTTATMGDAHPCLGGASPFAVVAIDIGGTKIAGGIVLYDIGATLPSVLSFRSVPTDAARGGAAVLQTACEQVLDLLRCAQQEPVLEGVKVVGVGVSTAGEVRESDGLIAYATDIMPGWMGQPLGARLEEATGLPVAVLNDVNAHALGEARHGAAQGAQTAVMAAAGTGLGGAIIVGGRIVTGAHGFAGMLGYVPCDEGFDVIGPWGANRGCLEDVASGCGIEATYRSYGGEPIGGAQISARAYAGEELAVRVVKQAGRCLGKAIASWAHVLDPEVVIISGSVLKTGPIWRDALEEGLRPRLHAAIKDLPIVEARLGDNAPIVGAAENLRDRIGI